MKEVVRGGAHHFLEGQLQSAWAGIECGAQLGDSDGTGDGLANIDRAPHKNGLAAPIP